MDLRSIEFNGEHVEKWFDCLNDDMAFGTAGDAFCSLWCYLHGADSWAANPDVACLQFRVVKENIDRIKEAA